MGSVTSEEESEERRGSYFLSADVSESESSSDHSDEVEGDRASSSAMFSLASGSSAPSLIFPVSGKDVLQVWDEKPQERDIDFSEIEMMKERFAKLLLGEDMSGGGNGVCTALAISNAITNLSATVFGELWRLEPMASLKKAIWRREMEWLLSVSDSIVELVPSIRQSPGGGTYEVMVSQPRLDLYMNLPALKKLDAMLISILEGFRNKEFWYDDRGIVVDDCATCSSVCGKPSVRKEEKWWLPCPKVPSTGLSEESIKRLQQNRECTHQILKAALDINSNVLAEMEIPTAYVETLPKNGKDCLDDIIYRYITADQFSPESLLDCLDLSSEHQTLDVANKIEAAMHVWKLKERKKHPDLQKSKRKSWGGIKGLVSDVEKNQFLAQRAETLSHGLRIRFPHLSQTALDVSKIQYNKDVGHSIIESYSRVIESLAFNIIARIDDVLYVDDAIKHNAAAEVMSIFNRAGGFKGLLIQRKMASSPFSIQHTPCTPPIATPICSSPPLSNSPRKSISPLNRCFDEVMLAGLDKLLSYAGNFQSKPLSMTDSLRSSSISKAN